MEEKPTYTHDIHAERLESMLKHKGDLHHFCPAAKDYSSSNRCTELWNEEISPCGVCVSFITEQPYSQLKGKCPCLLYGCEQAVELSFIALDNYHTKRRI